MRHATRFIKYIKCYSSLDEIEDKVDMVDIFRAKEFVLDVVKQAISIEAKTIAIVGASSNPRGYKRRRFCYSRHSIWPCGYNG